MSYDEESLEDLTPAQVFRNCRRHCSGVNAAAVGDDVVVFFGGRLSAPINDRIQEEYRKITYPKYRFTRDRFNFAKSPFQVVEKDGEVVLEILGRPNYEVNDSWWHRIRRNQVMW